MATDESPARPMGGGRAMQALYSMFTLPTLIFLMAPCVAGCPERPLEPRSPTPGAFHFTVQTFNVEFDDADDPSTVAAVGKADADVVCLQEVTPAWQDVLETTYGERYPHMLFHVKGPRSTGGMAILSRFPILDHGIQPALDRSPWHPAWHLSVDTPGGRIQVLHVHLRSPLTGQSSALESYLRVDADHRDEIETFHRVVEGEVPTVVLGDFNEEEDGAAIRWLETRGFTNALPLYHPGQGTWRYKSVANQLDKMLDHILYGPGLTPLNAWVKRSGNSDHLPVVAHLELSPN